MKVRQDRVAASAQKDGEFVKVKVYAVDDQIEFEGTPEPSSNKAISTLKAKTKTKL